MALSEQEQRLLDEMERSLYQHDADIVSTSSSAGMHVSSRSIVISVLAVALGLTIVVGAMALEQAWLGIIGFVVMVGTVYWACSSGRDSRTSAQGKESTASPSTDSTAKTPRTNRGERGFMKRMEDRWDRRQDERG